MAGEILVMLRRCDVTYCTHDEECDGPYVLEGGREAREVQRRYSSDFMWSMVLACWSVEVFRAHRPRL